jgi:hypothetical protein
LAVVLLLSEIRAIINDLDVILHDFMLQIICTMFFPELHSLTITFTLGYKRKEICVWKTLLLILEPIYLYDIAWKISYIYSQSKLCNFYTMVFRVKQLNNRMWSMWLLFCVLPFSYASWEDENYTVILKFLQSVLYDKLHVCSDLDLNFDSSQNNKFNDLKERSRNNKIPGIIIC